MKRRAGSRKRSRIRRFFSHPAGKVLVAGTVLLGTLSLITFSYFYLHFAQLTDVKLAEGPIGRTATLYAAPRYLSVGDEATVEELAAELTRAGYGENVERSLGSYRAHESAIEIYPGKRSTSSDGPVAVHIDRKRVAGIVSLRDNSEREQYRLEPELITNLFDRNREKRRIIRFGDVPKHLVNAILGAEDKRFFQHSGFDPIRVLKAFWVTYILGDRVEGASTLTMQLAGDIWLDRRQRTPRRKASEMLITIHLERKLTKEQIFEHYANQIYLGRIGTFDIHGYGQAARAYFNKDITALTLTEAALLAGLPRGPSRYNPFRNPNNATARRNWVLRQMLEIEAITQAEYDAACEAPLGVQMGGSEVGDAPYFVDLANSWLRDRFQDHDFQAANYAVYTSLDMNLQREAVEAVRVGIEEVDKRLASLGRTKENGWPEAQVALAAIDPRTGAVKALVGGRSYAGSQLNRVMAKRQPGSVFKPFVYAAALDTGVTGGPMVMTNQTAILDEPTTFWYDDKPYEPHNYKNKVYGLVTFRQALTKSMNIPTVKVAEMAGYDSVVNMARRAGLNLDIQPTPAVALGSYEVTPLEIAGAYTMFANNGEVVTPHFIEMIRDREGGAIYEHQVDSRLMLDPRVAYLMVNLLEDVIQTGTGVRVRLMGFNQPAAGKTGTSHDGWFAGFTSELLTAVWVGYDDNRELKLEGAQSALPIWAEFMKRAHTYREYRNPRPFRAPDGIVNVDIDPETGKLAAAGCGSDPIAEVFVAGTQPVQFCNGAGTQVAGWDVADPSLMASNTPQPGKRISKSTATSPRQVEMPPATEKKKKKGLWGRFVDIFR
ncbi:MAG: PBP1A family penicillin-binding protein [bacterium]|nr:PBP1A family penicillin-binding protein [bacterium]